MRESQSLDLQVTEESPGEVRCILPARPPHLGLYLMGFGILAPALLGAITLLTTPFPGDGLPLVVLLPLVLFALFLTGMGLWLAAGHVEVGIRLSTLYSVARLGPLKWSRSFPVGRIRRFQIHDMAGKAGRAAAPRSRIPADMAILLADVTESKPVALALFYPRDLLQRLADELSRHCEFIQAEPPSLESLEASPEQQAAHATPRQPQATCASPPGPWADDLPTVPAVDSSGQAGTTLPYRLAPGGDRPGCMLAYTFFFMVVWWGFISFWGLGLLQSHRQDPALWKNVPAGMKTWLWFQTIFFIPFGLAGLWLVGSFLRQLYLILGRRRTRVEVSAQPLHLGEAFEVFVSQSGPLQLKSLRVLLVCEEEASYGQGTDVRTETRRTQEEEVVREDAFAIARGFPYEVHREARVPARAMHTFEAKRNKVRWLVVVSGDVAGWSSFERKFPVVVHPAPGDGSGHE
jgi:hypothetical protein